MTVQENILIFCAKSCPDVPVFHPAFNVYIVISKITGMSTVVVLWLLSGHSSSLYAGVLWAVRTWRSLACCGSAVMWIWRRHRAETWSRSRPRSGPISVYWPDTMGQRGKQHQQHQTKPHSRDRMTGGKGRRAAQRQREREKGIYACGNKWVIVLLGLLQRERAVSWSVYGWKMLCCSF